MRRLLTTKCREGASLRRGSANHDHARSQQLVPRRAPGGFCDPFWSSSDGGSWATVGAYRGGMLSAPGWAAMLAAALPGCPAPSALLPRPANRPTYAMTIAIASNRKVVRGTSRVLFALDRSTDRIVFRLWANMPVQRRAGARLEVRNVRVNGTAVPTGEPDPTTLLLPRPLAVGERVSVSLRWTLR